MFKSFLRRRKKETSTLNTDRFDRRRFEQIYEMSKGLQKIEKVEELPLFKELLGDMWASLYKTNPELKEDDLLNDQLLPNKQLMQHMMEEESYQEYRESTQLDDLLSAVGTVNFGNQTSRWLDEQRFDNEELKKQMEQIKKLMNQMSKEEKTQESLENNQEDDTQDNGAGQEGENVEEQKQSQTEQELNQAMSDLAKQLNQSLQENGKSFSQAMNKAVEETKSAKKGLESLFGGIEAGNQRGELENMPLRHKIALAEIISHDRKIKEIAKWAGRYTQVAQTKQKMKYKSVTEQSGVESGDDLQKILPSELALYANQSTKKEFLRKYTEKETLQYEQKGKESLGRGSIVLCLDQSLSMQDMETESKGFALALMSIAKKQKRNFAYIPFNTNVGRVKQFPKGKIKPNEMIQLAREFTGGGTSFLPPLKKAIEIINKDRFKDADIIFVTDGSSGMSEDFMKKFNERKEKDGFNVLSLLIGDHSSERTVSHFSDRVVKVDGLKDKASFEAFEI